MSAQPNVRIAAAVMMNKKTILVTGGVRSGKSKYAEQRVVSLGPRRLYLATAEARDEEMALRIAQHQQRRGGQWSTVEEPVEIGSVLLSHRGRLDAALVDCLTLWLSNLVHQRDWSFAEEKVRELLEILPRLDFHVVLVTNEVGWGIVPDNALARAFRDFAGSVNQRVGAAANEVVLMVAGLPMIVKEEARCS